MRGRFIGFLCDLCNLTRQFVVVVQFDPVIKIIPEFTSLCVSGHA
jgi:hypothetical protein